MRTPIQVVAVLLSIVLFAAATPTLDSISPTTLNTHTTTAVVVTGTGFSSLSSVKVWISGIECLSAVVLTDTTIGCTAEAGLGSDNTITLWWATDATHNGTVSEAFVDFEAVVSPKSCAGEVKLFPVAGTASVTICGSHFGEASSTTDLTNYKGIFSVYLPYGIEGEVSFHGDDVLIVEFPTDGVGADLPVTIRLGSQIIVVANVTVNYPEPSLTSVTQKNTRESNSLSLIFMGSQFGQPSPLLVLYAWLGPFACTSVVHVSTHEFHCVVHSISGSNLIPRLRRAGQEASLLTPARFDYNDVPAAGQTCAAPFGTVAINDEYCNCWSGHASVDTLLQKDCDIHAKCPGIIISSNAVTASPARPTTHFEDDKLMIKQTMPIEKGRRDTVIQFLTPHLNKTYTVPSVDPGTHGSDQCSYPGPIWVKKVNDLDCVDEFYAVLQWSQHELCGFVEQVDPATLASDNHVFKTYMLSISTYTFKTNSGLKFHQTKTGYLLTVTFARQLKVKSSVLTVVIANPDLPISLSVEVESSVVYDVASKNTFVTFTTTVVWPYKLAGTRLPAAWMNSTGIFSANTVNATITLDSTQDGKCDQEEDSECEQTWIMELSTSQVCNLFGSVTINATGLDCRDYTTVGLCAGYPNTTFTINIGNTNLCSDTEVDASKGVKAVLQSFYDEDLTIEQNIFQTGDMIYFVVAVSDPISTIDKVTFSQVSLYNNEHTTITDDLYIQNTPGDLVSTASTFLVDTQFNITGELREQAQMLSPGEVGALAFQFRLNRDELNVVENLASPALETASITVQVTLDVFYHGNMKRTITAATPAIAKHQLSFYTPIEDEDTATTADKVANDETLFGMWSGAHVNTPFAAVFAVCVFVAALFV